MSNDNLMKNFINILNSNKKYELNDFLKNHKEFCNIKFENDQFNYISMLILKFNYNIAEIFMLNGADINIYVHNNTTLFRYCLLSNNYKGLHLLIKYDVDLFTNMPYIYSNIYYLFEKIYKIYKNMISEQYRFHELRKIVDFIIRKYETDENHCIYTEFMKFIKISGETIDTNFVNIFFKEKYDENIYSLECQINDSIII